MGKRADKLLTAFFVLLAMAGLSVCISSFLRISSIAGQYDMARETQIQELKARILTLEQELGARMEAVEEEE